MATKAKAGETKRKRITNKETEDMRARGVLMLSDEEHKRFRHAVIDLGVGARDGLRRLVLEALGASGY